MIAKAIPLSVHDEAIYYYAFAYFFAPHEERREGESRASPNGLQSVEPPGSEKEALGVELPSHS